MKTQKKTKAKSKRTVGTKNHRAKLTAVQVARIRKWHKAGRYTQTEMAKRYGVTPTAIYLIVHNKTWKEVA